MNLIINQTPTQAFMINTHIVIPIIIKIDKIVDNFLIIQEALTLLKILSKWLIILPCKLKISFKIKININLMDWVIWEVVLCIAIPIALKLQGQVIRKTIITILIQNSKIYSLLKYQVLGFSVEQQFQDIMLDKNLIL